MLERVKSYEALKYLVKHKNFSETTTTQDIFIIVNYVQYYI